jgi:hypothetical protein
LSSIPEKDPQEGLPVSQRITDRLRAHAAREGLDFDDLRRSIWGRLFGIARVAADRTPVDALLLADGATSRRLEASGPTVAAAVRQATDDGQGALANALACAGLRQEALVGDAEAGRLLRNAGGQIADRLDDGVLTVHADGSWKFVSDAVPLREFVDLPARELNLRRRNSLRSRVFKRRIGRSSWFVRLGLLARGLYDVLAPFYESPGHPTSAERRRGVFAKAAQYPEGLLRDIADLLVAWRDGEYVDLTPEQVRGAIRRHAPPR